LNILQDYEEKKSLADYLATISSTGSTEVQFTDNKTRQLFNRVQLSLKSNLLLGLYSEGLAAFNQFIFPFAADFASDLSFPKFTTIQNKNELVAQTIQKINLIEEKLKLYKSTVHKIDERRLEGYFSSSVPSSVPFYTWSSIKFGQEITNLLSGETVTLLAHPEQGPRGRLCVKFTTIKLVLQWKGSGEDSQHLMKELEYFQIKMKHHGRSYYMAARNEVYVIEGNPIEVAYTNTSYSLSRRKLSDGDSTISPYGMWTLQIKTIPENNRTFDNLKIHSRNVDLHLEGKGTFVYENSLDFKSLNLDRYYKKVDQV